MVGATASRREDQATGRRGLSTRLMIVDDSMVARAVLSRMVTTGHEFEIAAVAGTAEDAIVALGETMVDIILLDLEMPGVGGLKALPKIIEAARGAQILIVSSLAEDGAEETMAALAMGAADTLPKPGTGRFNGKFSEVLVERLRSLASGAKRPKPQPKLPEPKPVPTKRDYALRNMPDAALELLAIGSSTGGIHALQGFFSTLPARIGVPILVTQHLPAAFMPVFARQLMVASGRAAHVAEDGQPLVADEIYIAPGDRHLCVEQRRSGFYVRLVEGRVASGCMPSVDPMLASAAAEIGPGALGIILTGMGRDGSEGATKLVACGGGVLAQNEESCAVWGMPRSIAEAGLACGLDTPEGLALRVASRAGVE